MRLIDHGSEQKLGRVALIATAALVRGRWKVSICAEKLVLGTGSRLNMLPASITGGIEATARLLAGDGARVVLGARRTDRIEKLVQQIDTQMRSESRCHPPTGFRSRIEMILVAREESVKTPSNKEVEDGAH